MDREELDNRDVYIYSEDTNGVVLEWGAYFSTVKYTDKGNDYEVLMENEDFILISDLMLPEFWEDAE